MNMRKPINLKWDGVEYKTIVNMSLIARIDDEIGIIKLMSMKKDNPKIFIIIQLVYILLEEAGAVVVYEDKKGKKDTRSISLEDIYDGMGDKADPKALFSVLREITPMLMPNFNGIAKKKAAPRKKRKASKKK